MTASLVSASASAIVAAAGRLPPGIVARIGGGLGGAAWWLDRRHRLAAVRNIARVHARSPRDPWVRSMARDAFGAAGEAFGAGASLLGARDEDRVRAQLRVEGVEHLDAAHRAGRGIVGVACHLGPWESMTALPAVLPWLRIGVMYRSMHNRGFDQTTRRLRSRFGTRLFDIPDGYRRAARFVRDGGALGILVDQYAGTAGRWAPFLGIPASTTRAPYRLAMMANAVVLPMEARHEPGTGFTVVFRDPIPTEPGEEDRFLAAMNEALGTAIRARPRQWFWMHDRWRTPRRALSVGEGPAPRILVRGVNWLGDTIMTLPALQRIRDGAPGARITLTGPAGLASLFAADPRIDRYVPLPKGSPWRVGAALADEPYDVAIVLPNSARSALEARCAGAPSRVGFRGHHRRALLTRALDPPTGDARGHQSLDYLEIIRALGGPAEPCPPRVFIAAADEAFARDLVGDRGAGVVGMHPGAQYGPAKQWIPERFAEVARRFVERGMSVFLFGGPDEKQLTEAIATAAGERGVVDLGGRTTLGQLAALLAACDVVISNDSGPMHLAGAVGAPVVAVFGSTDPDRTAPLGTVRVVRELVPCGPCFRRRCPIDFPCMRRITVGKVMDAAEELLTGGDGA